MDNTPLRDTAIYEDVMDFISNQSQDLDEAPSDSVKDLVYKIVKDMDEGCYSLEEFTDNPNIIEWFEEVIKDDYEEAGELTYDEAITMRELTITYIKEMYKDGDYGEEEDYYDDQDLTK